MYQTVKMQVDGQLERVVNTVVEAEGVHLVGIQVPLGHKGVPSHLLQLVRSCRAAVLLHRDRY